ncbi:MAG: UDP-N-acetylmuramoyl-L-alanyl-D-glutamate--2,6-diaminopimelate ligase [Thermodesulfovibrionales bacterium]
MRLKGVIRDCMFDEDSLSGPFLDTEISGIAYDSRKVVNNGLFVALKGENYDGNDFIMDAIDKGARVVVFEGNSMNSVRDLIIARDVLLIKVKDPRMALACLSNNFYGRPSEILNVVGVTGTNGKTTTTHLIRTILETWGEATGLIGTISYSFKGHDYPALHTTPEAVEFQSLLKDMLDSGCSYVVTEVSSHSLKQRRVDYTRFSTAVFTNLTRDHLDFHRTMEDYYLSKRRLFTDLLIDYGTAVINIDDEWGKRLFSELSSLRPDLRIITYGIKADATVNPVMIDGLNADGLRLKIGLKTIPNYPFTSSPLQPLHIDSPLIGIPNIYNVLSAVSVAVGLKIPEEIIIKGLRKDTVVRGRFEKVEAGQDFLCIIDYAHTPDALERLILTAREIISKGRVITVFGCGGNRDKGKRPLMGRIATELSDYVIITSDNPRNEDPADIISDIISGVIKNNYEIVPERADAIERAVLMAESGDILLIAGKGHEDYQEIKGKRERFSDRDVCINAISGVKGVRV